MIEDRACRHIVRRRTSMGAMPRRPIYPQRSIKRKAGSSEEAFPTAMPLPSAGTYNVEMFLDDQIYANQFHVGLSHAPSASFIGRLRWEGLGLGSWRLRHNTLSSHMS